MVAVCLAILALAASPAAAEVCTSVTPVLEERPPTSGYKKRALHADDRPGEVGGLHEPELLVRLRWRQHMLGPELERLLRRP